jgi:aspartyl-tRNA(Asn)/glutamyl-tRNA(Gln) amidotransferase subunit C
MRCMSAPPSISLEDVRHLAALARIELDDARLAVLAGELDVILRAVAQVAEVAGDDVPPTSHPLPLTNVFRPDDVRPSLSAADALAAAPAVESGRFRVPRILDEEA